MTTTPTEEEVIKTEFIQIIARDIANTFIKGGASHPDFYYYEIPSPDKEKNYRKKALTHLCTAHQFEDGPDAYDLKETETNIPTGKSHLANALARLAVARYHQILRESGQDHKYLRENNPDD